MQSAGPVSLVWTPPQPPCFWVWEIEVDVERDFPGLLNFKEYILDLVDECKEKEPEACEKHPPILHKSKAFMLNRYWFVKDEGTKVSNEDEMEKKIERKGYKQDLISSMIGGAEVVPAVKDKKDDAHLKAFKQVLKQLATLNKRTGSLLFHADPVCMSLKRKDPVKYDRFRKGVEKVREAYMHSLEEFEQFSEKRFGVADVMECDKTVSQIEKQVKDIQENYNALDAAIKANEEPLIQEAEQEGEEGGAGAPGPEAEQPAKEGEGEDLKAEPLSQGA